MERLVFHIKQVNKSGKFKWAIRNMAYPDCCLTLCSSRKKTDNRWEKERNKWLKGATEYYLIAEKEDKDG